MRRSPFRFISRRELKRLECTPLARVPFVLHAFSTRLGGLSRGTAAGLNLGFVGGDSQATVEENRKIFLQSLGAEGFALAATRQVHSSEVLHVGRGPSGTLEYRPPASHPSTQLDPRPLAGDALLTDEPGILLGVKVADCLPILIVDVRRRAVAAIHAGWRGTLKGILEKAVAEMARVFGSSARDLVAAVGPSIHACCYEVGEEVVAAFRARFAWGEEFFRRAPLAGPTARLRRRNPGFPRSATLSRDFSQVASKAHLDLVAVARDQLRRAGLHPANLHVSEFCTACRTDLFYSHRQEGSGTGRMMGVIGIRPRV